MYVHMYCVHAHAFCVCVCVCAVCLLESWSDYEASSYLQCCTEQRLHVCHLLFDGPVRCTNLSPWKHNGKGVNNVPRTGG